LRKLTGKAILEGALATDGHGSDSGKRLKDSEVNRIVGRARLAEATHFEIPEG